MRSYGLVLVGMLAAACGSEPSSTRTDLSVTASPTGEITVTRGGQGQPTGPMRVVLTFSKPMVAPDQVGRPTASPPLVIAPNLAGRATWVDDRTLAFVPTARLPASTKFVATVPGTTRALDGNQLGKPHRFEFFADRLTGTVEALGSKLRAPRIPVVKLTFTQEVAFDQIDKHCGFSAGNHKLRVKLAPDSASGPGETFTIVPVAELTMDADWTVGCRAGLRGSIGDLGLAANLEDKLHTYGPLRFVTLDPSGNDIVPEESTKIALAFSNPLAPPYQIKISPAVAGFPQRCHALGDAPAGLSCGAQLEPRTAYTITIAAGQKDVFGQQLDKPQALAFRTADAQPTISMESGYFVAELARPVIPIWTRNVSELAVTAVRLTPANFHELAPLIDWWNAKPADLSKTKLTPRALKLPIAGTTNKWGQHSIGAAELFAATPGPGMFYVELGSKEVQRAPYVDDGRQKVLVNFTDIGVVSKLSGTRGLVWTTRLSTGKPLPGAAVTVRDRAGKLTWSGTTDADGVAILPGMAKLGGAGGDDESGHGGGESAEFRIFVAHQQDFTMVNPTRVGGLAPWNFNVDYDRDPAPTRLRGFMHTDRGLYRPGEKVHVKGIARVTKLGEPLAAPGQGKPVKVTVDGPQGKTVIETFAKLSAFGGFWFDLDLPGDARLGDYRIHAKLEHGTFTREFTVEEYRPATFEVTGKVKVAQVVRRGTIQATVSANYLYGAPLRAGDVNITVHSRPRWVSFPQHPEFAFRDERNEESYSDESDHSQTLVTEDKVALDDKGNAAVSVTVSPDDVYRDSDLLIRASVTAPSNEEISKTFTVPYYRSKRYFGIRSPGYVLDIKKPQKFQILAVSPDGKPADGTAKVTVTRRDWNCVWEDWGYRGSYQCKDKHDKILERSVQLVGGKPAEIEFTPTTGGDYWVVVEGEQDKQEAAAAAAQVYVWGDGGGSWRSDDTLTFDLVADKKEYKAGDTATLIMKTDLAEATGLVTIERDGVIEKRLVQVTPTQKHVSIPITADHAPNVYVSVALVQGRKGDGPRGKPRMRMGLVNLPVRPEDNKLVVTVETDRKDYRPGAPVTATVKVVDANGKPVSAEVSITAADEGVLSLIGYETPNPVPTFYAPWAIGVTTATQLEYIRDIPAPNLERPATGGDAAGTLRSRFVSTAVWTPGAVTNAAGLATVKFTAPDNLTAFRIMAVAADQGTRFGSADKRFTVSKPLQLHQVLPRFLSLGDQLKGGVVVHNETGAPGSATVKLVTDARIKAGTTEQTVALAKGARVPVLFDLTAIELGESSLAFSVTMNGERDAVMLTLPIGHPSPEVTQHVAHAASKTAAKIPLVLPPDAIASSAQLVISVDPDGLAGIEDGLRDLIHYPYGCLEQTTSKMIPMIAVRDLADSLSIGGLTGDKLQGFVMAGIAKIGRHQTAYGGFSLWPGGEPEAYYTAYALWGLHLAKQGGYRVDQDRINEGLQYLRADGKTPDTARPYYDEAGNLGSQAFALYVRALYKDKDATAAATTLTAHPKLPVFGKAFLARALAARLGAKDPAVKRQVAELGEIATAAMTAGTLIVEPADKDLDWYMSSSLRTTAIVLAALVELEPKHPAVKPLVHAIMKQRRIGQDLDTQENLYSLLALASYAKTISSQPPTVALSLGGTPLWSGTLAGKQRIRVVTAPLPATGELSIAPRGEVHYNVVLRYRRKPETLTGASNGLAIKREYLDEFGLPKTTFTVGDVVVVKLTTQLKSDANHLMISDALPAGFEALNARLATVGPSAVRQTQSWGTYRELRDDRVDFASEYNSQGEHVYEYTMRAIAVGTFARPPAVGELMYEPGTNAQTALDLLEVKAK